MAAILLNIDPDLRIAIAAPTGKAAARMEEAIAAAVENFPANFSDVVAKLTLLQATTLHRLLGWTPMSGNRFFHNASNLLPYDVIVVDEASMVNVVLMSRLLSAMRPNARLVLVGDPNQLAPVEAGAVLADIAENPWSSTPALSQGLTDFGLEPSGNVVVLNKNHRFSGSLDDLANAVLAGDPLTSLDLAKAHGVLFADTEASDLRNQVTAAGIAAITAARQGLGSQAIAAMNSHRLLCANRSGSNGVERWSREIKLYLAKAGLEYDLDSDWQLGLPLLVTKNNPDLDLWNGDTGVVIADSSTESKVAFFPRIGTLPVFLLDQVENAYALTVHKAQGSQFDAVTLILPSQDSVLLNREMLYTAITRAKTRVQIIGSDQAFQHAVSQRAPRASGLSRSLTVM
ncbi:MAG: exodeoxyribonuclease V subunit alpha [Propionibacteriaceae bacterium]|nr:exodeoxyribonuclease V subunit alpha [Propionibacteriaceae bacterium]